MKRNFFFPVICALSLLGGAGCKSYVDAVGGGGDGGSGGSGGTGGDDGTTSTTTDSTASNTPVNNGCAPDDAASTEAELIVAGKAGALAADDAWVFFVGEESVPYRVPVCGGTPVPVVPADGIGNGSGAALIALDATHVYWTAYQTFPNFELWRAPKEGGTPELLTDKVGPNNSSPAAIAVDDQFVYFSQPDIFNSNDDPDKLQGVIRRVPKAGGPVEDLASGYSLTLAVDSSFLYWARLNQDGTGSVIRAGKDGSSPTPIATELGPTDGFSAAGDRLFWTYTDAGVFSLRTSENGGAPLTLGTTDTYVGPPAATQDAIYWIRPGDTTSGAVFRLATDGTLTQLAEAPASPNAPFFFGAYGARVAVNSNAVFWSYEGAAGGAPRIYRVAR
ncbi:MAG: hypothetical protein R3B70_27515 [Polyangiaceae bacterium]